MKKDFLLLLFLSLSNFVCAQQTEPMSLKQAVHQAWESSNPSKISEEKVIAAKEALKITRNDRYPDFLISGQAAYLTDPHLDLKIRNNADNSDDGRTSEIPVPHYLLLGQANLSLPLFSGFKINNAVKAGKNDYKDTEFSSKSDKADIAVETIKKYVMLYKAIKTGSLVRQNLASAKERVRVFKNMEKNGLVARNDLLKVELQQSHVALALAKAKKTERVLNYQLVKFLKLPENQKISIDTLSFELPEEELNSYRAVARPDIEALRYQKKAAEKRVKVEKGNYFPSIALTGGYIAADIESTLTLTRMFNIGVKLSYNLADIFKNKSKVRLAQSRARDLQLKLDDAKDKMDMTVQNTREAYQLSIENYKVYQKARKQAIENYRIVKDKYDNGLLETRDLLEADVKQLQSKIDMAVAKAEITLKYYELLKAKGYLINEFSNN